MPILNYFKFFIVSLVLIFYCPNAFASSMLGSESKPKKIEINIPKQLELIITNLLNVTTAEATLPNNNSIKQILTYIESIDDPSKINPKKREFGTGAFYRGSINVPMKELLEYCYNPLIPSEALYPSSIRYSVRLPDSQFVVENVKLWEELDQLPKQKKPIIHSAKELVEVTPDTFSNCYYSYNNDSIYILTTLDDRNVLIAINKQSGKSDVGKVGAIIGNDSNWEYLYSDKVGSNINFVRWTKTFLYNSAIVKFYYPSKNDASVTNIAFFKYLDAGWSNLNMIQRSHIYSGSQRSISGLREVMQSPLRPSVTELINKNMSLLALNNNELLAELQSYSIKLAAFSTKSSKHLNKIFKQILIDQIYVKSLNAQHMRSELLKQYIKDTLHKTSIISHS